MSSSGRLEEVLDGIVRGARIPGAGLAVVAGGELVFAKGSGYRDVRQKLPLTSNTVYPIASTTKALNATLLAMLVDEGCVSWDTPVQEYVPDFRLYDPLVSAQVTLRDLIVMRTGLPRHDWVWLDTPLSRAELVTRLRHLQLSAGFRERFQYNNIAVTAAGYVAEVVTGASWEQLVQQRLLAPLGMRDTRFALPTADDITLSYGEDAADPPIECERLMTGVTAPSGGAIHSTVEDMARWIAFNLADGTGPGGRLITAGSSREIHLPQMVVGTDPTAPTPNAAYGMGWFIDTYNGRRRSSHGGLLHDVNSSVMLFPDDRIGMVSFTNSGFGRLASLINEHAFDALMGLSAVQTLEARLAQFRQKCDEARQRRASSRRRENTTPSHALSEYAGEYAHPGYGPIRISAPDATLMFQRSGLSVALKHWHYDVWVANDIATAGSPHPFDNDNRLVFEANADGDIVACSLSLEPAVAPIRFSKR